MNDHGKTTAAFESMQPVWAEDLYIFRKITI